MSKKTWIRKMNFDKSDSPVKAKFGHMLVVGDWVNTRPKGVPRNEQIIKIEQNEDERILDLTTASGTYQVLKGSLVLP